MNRKIRIVAISDTHSRHQQINVPDGDILIHAGDATMAGGVAEIAAFDHWLGTLPHPVKLFCAGNHDLLFERNPALARGLITNATYLQDELIEALGLRIYFSPWQPRFFDWAFNLDRGAALRAKWDLIPWPLDVLVTHGPPMGILDAASIAVARSCAPPSNAAGRALTSSATFTKATGHSIMTAFIT